VDGDLRAIFCLLFVFEFSNRTCREIRTPASVAFDLNRGIKTAVFPFSTRQTPKFPPPISVVAHASIETYRYLRVGMGHAA
jgi:hypothetical protein